MLGCRPSPSSLIHLLSYVRGLLGWGSCHAIALLLLYHYLSFISLLRMGLRANVSAVPVHLPHHYLFWALQANIPSMPTHFIPRVLLTHLRLLYLFYSHGLLLNPLGFLGPTITSLPLIHFGLIDL